MVFRFMTRLNESNNTKNKYFCSELVFCLLKFCGINLFNNTEGWQVSPHLLSRSIKLKKLNEKYIAYGKLLNLSKRIK